MKLKTITRTVTTATIPEIGDLELTGVHGTGNPIEGNPGEYVATFQMYNGGLVFHVFDQSET